MTQTKLQTANEKLLKLQREYQHQEKRYSFSYWLYPRSHHWREKRWKVLRRAGYMCEACSKNPAVAVHHIRYPKRWGDEPLEWLQAVCKECHNGLHDYETREQVKELRL